MKEASHVEAAAHRALCPCLGALRGFDAQVIRGETESGHTEVFQATSQATIVMSWKVRPDVEDVLGGGVSPHLQVWM